MLNHPLEIYIFPTDVINRYVRTVWSIFSEGNLYPNFSQCHLNVFHYLSNTIPILIQYYSTTIHYHFNAVTTSANTWFGIVTKGFGKRDSQHVGDVVSMTNKLTTAGTERIRRIIPHSSFANIWIRTREICFPCCWSAPGHPGPTNLYSHLSLPCPMDLYSHPLSLPCPMSIIVLIISCWGLWPRQSCLTCVVERTISSTFVYTACRWPIGHGSHKRRTKTRRHTHSSYIRM